MTFKVKDGLQVGSTLAIDANGKLTTSLSTPRTITLSGDVSGSASFDGSANITITTTNTANSIALGTDTTGNYMVNVAAGGGISVSHTQGEGSTATVSHSDTSSVSNLSSDNSSGTVIQDVALTFDTYGHVTGASVGTVNLDGRYYTEGESDVAFGKSHSGSDFVDGTLVTTNIPATAASGASFVLEATGKSYSSSPPHDFKVQGYLYNSTIINYSGVSNGAVQSYVKVMEYGGYLCFWWPRWGYWNSYQVHVRDAGGSRENRVTSITNSALPAGNKIVQINLNQSALYNYSGGASGSLYAATYYDGNDTGYYVDPNGTSNINALSAYNVSSHLMFFRNQTSAMQIENQSTFTRMSFNELRFYEWDGGGDIFTLNGNYGQFANSARAPIFYDSDNTGYYVDPNGITNIGGVNNFPLRVTKTSGYNSGCAQFLNQYGDNSWGIVADFRVGSGAGSDRPSIMFSNGYDTNTWSVGFGYNDSSYFRINRDHGYVNSSWGTTLMTMDRSGNVTFAGNVTAYSDRRIKKNIKNIENPIQKVQALNGVTFNYIDDDREGLGVIAQEVEAVMPMLVTETPSSNGEVYKNVAYGNMVGLLIEAIKEQQTQIDELKSMVQALLNK